MVIEGVDIEPNEVGEGVTSESKTPVLLRWEINKIPEVIAYFHSLAVDDNYDSFNEERRIVKFKVAAYDVAGYPRLADVESIYLKYREKEKGNDGRAL